MHTERASEFERWGGKDASRAKAEADSTHGPDASRHAGEDAEPELVQARLYISKLIEQPPKGSITMKVDYYCAMALLERNTKNRRLNQLKTKEFMRSLREDNWDHNGETIKVSWEGILIDGQKRLTAVARTRIPMVTEVIFNLDPDSFKTIDIGQSRSASDVLGINGKANTNRLSAAARLLVRYEADPRMSTYLRPTIAEIEAAVERHPLIEHPPEGIRLSGIHGLPGSVVTFLWTIAAEYDRKKAEDFFERLVKGLNIVDENDPADRLRKLSLGMKKRRRHVSADEFAAICIKAWNAFAQGKTISAHALRWRTEGDAPELFPEAVTKKSARPQKS